MPSIIKTDKIENLSGETIVSYSQSTGPILGSAAGDGKNKTVQTVIHKQTISQDVITKEFGARLDPLTHGDFEGRNGYPAPIYNIPSFTKKSSSNTVLIQLSFQPYIKALEKKYTCHTTRNFPEIPSAPFYNHTHTWGAGYWGRYYLLVNTESYNISRDLTSIRNIYTSSDSFILIEILYINNFPLSTVIGRGINIGQSWNYHDICTFIYPSTRVTIIDNYSNDSNLTRTYRLFALAGHEFRDAPSTSPGASKPTNPRHGVGLAEGTMISVIMTEMKETTPVTEIIKDS